MENFPRNNENTEAAPVAPQPQNIGAGVMAAAGTQTAPAETFAQADAFAEHDKTVEKGTFEQWFEQHKSEVGDTIAESMKNEDNFFQASGYPYDRFEQWYGYKLEDKGYLVRPDNGLSVAYDDSDGTLWQGIKAKHPAAEDYSLFKYGDALCIHAWKTGKDYDGNDQLTTAGMDVVLLKTPEEVKERAEKMRVAFSRALDGDSINDLFRVAKECSDGYINDRYRGDWSVTRLLDQLHRSFGVDTDGEVPDKLERLLDIDGKLSFETSGVLSEREQNKNWRTIFEAKFVAKELPAQKDLTAAELTEHEEKFEKAARKYFAKEDLSVETWPSKFYLSDRYDGFDANIHFTNKELGIDAHLACDRDPVANIKVADNESGKDYNFTFSWGSYGGHGPADFDNRGGYVRMRSGDFSYDLKIPSGGDSMWARDAYTDFDNAPCNPNELALMAAKYPHALIKMATLDKTGVNALGEKYKMESWQDEGGLRQLISVMAHLEKESH